jgi:hypothetical protein
VNVLIHVVVVVWFCVCVGVVVTGGRVEITVCVGRVAVTVPGGAVVVKFIVPKRLT